MRISFLATISVALTLVGCTTLPKTLDDVRPISAGDIFRAVSCEFVRGAQVTPALNQTSAVIALSLSRTDDITIAPSAEWTGTMGGVTLSSTPSGSVSTNAVSVVNVTHSLELVGEDAVDDCPGELPDQPSGLGLAAELSRQMMLIEGAGPNDEIGDMTITHTFSVNRTVGGGLEFSIGDVKIGFDGSKASRDNVHTLTIGLQPIRGRGDADKAQQDIKDRLEQEDRNQKLYEAIRDATENNASVL
jgi:hypothetical protein